MQRAIVTTVTASQEVHREDSGPRNLGKTGAASMRMRKMGRSINKYMLTELQIFLRAKLIRATLPAISNEHSSIHNAPQLHGKGGPDDATACSDAMLTYTSTKGKRGRVRHRQKDVQRGREEQKGKSRTRRTTDG